MFGGQSPTGLVATLAWWLLYAAIVGALVKYIV